MSDCETSCSKDSLQQKIEARLSPKPEGTVLRLDFNMLGQLGSLYQESRVSLDDFAEVIGSSKIPEPLARNIRTMLRCPVFRKEVQSASHPDWPDAYKLIWKDLRERIHRIVADLDEHESERNGGRFRELCRLARDWDVDPESFRKLLIRARMSGARASEIKAVLEATSVCREFSREKDPISWKQALEEARKQNPKADRLRQAARKIVGLVLGNQHLWDKNRHNDLTAPATIRVQRTAAGRFTIVHPSVELTLVLKFPAP